MIRRLKKRLEFLYVTQGGQSVKKKSLILVMRQRPSDDQDVGVGFTASKRVGNAVIRNRCKRRLRSIVDKSLRIELLRVIKLRKITLNEKSFDFVLIATRSTAEISFEKICQDFSSAIELCIHNTMSIKNFPQVTEIGS